MNAERALEAALGADVLSEEKMEYLLEAAKDIILDEIGRDELPERLVSAQVQLAVIMFEREGAWAKAHAPKALFHGTLLTDCQMISDPD